MDDVVAAFEAGEDRVVRGVPHLLVACAETEKPTPEANGFIALTTLGLAASSAGLGSCRAENSEYAADNVPRIHGILQVRSIRSLRITMMLGRPRPPPFRLAKIPARNQVNITHMR